MYSKLLFLSAFLCSAAIFVSAVPAPFEICKDRPSSAVDVTVDVEPCPLSGNRTCQLTRGTKSNFTLTFVNKVHINGPIERLIMAKFSKQMKGKDVDVAYGGPVPSGNKTFEADTMNMVEGRNMTADRKYIHNDLFDVLESAPKTSLNVRYLIRETKPCKKSKCNFLRHPGDLMVCIEIPVSIV